MNLGEEVSSMTMRTTDKIITFHRPFCLKGVDRVLPPAAYRVMTDEELIEGLLFPAYRRVSTAIFVPAPSGSAVEMVPIDPQDLQAAQERDAILLNAETSSTRKFRKL
jgi:hypothetical protein